MLQNSNPGFYAVKPDDTQELFLAEVRPSGQYRLEKAKLEAQFAKAQKLVKIARANCDMARLKLEVALDALAEVRERLEGLR